MPARRSEDPSLTDAEKSGDRAREHWDAAARRAARPAPLHRSSPNRDLGGDDADAPPCADDHDPSLTRDDAGESDDMSPRPEVTDE